MPSRVEYLERQFNIEDVIKQYLPEIKEAFIIFCGEKYREHINSRLEQTIFISEMYTRDIIKILNMIFVSKAEEIATNLLESCDVFVSEENIDFIVGFLNDYEILNEEFLTKLNINEEMLLKSKRMYEDFKKKYQSYLDYYEVYVAYENKVKEDYFVQFLQKAEVILENTEILISNIIMKNLKDYFYSSSHILDAFNLESQRNLGNDQIPNFINDSIKKDRISYLKENFMDLGDNYESYLKNPEVKKIIELLLDIMQQIAVIKALLLDKMEKDLIYNSPERKNNVKRMLTLLDNSKDFFVNSLLDENRAFAHIEIIDDDSRTENKIIPIIFFPNMYYEPSIQDTTLIHECNHILEGRVVVVYRNQIIKQFSQKRKTVFYGFQSTTYSGNLGKRAINEIINDLIAEDVVKILHHNGVYIFDTPEKTVNYWENVYRLTEFIVRDFYEEFKSDIIENRLDGNDTLLKKIGIKNFEALSDLVEEYSHFIDFEKADLIQEALKKGFKTPEVLYYIKVLSRKENIMEKIRENAINFSKK